jgi:hypothetical protein
MLVECPENCGPIEGLEVTHWVAFGDNDVIAVRFGWWDQARGVYALDVPVYPGAAHRYVPQAYGMEVDWIGCQDGCQFHRDQAAVAGLRVLDLETGRLYDWTTGRPTGDYLLSEAGDVCAHCGGASCPACEEVSTR